ncbi:alpha/beta hydrolase [Amycolatopsis sp. cg5]|uniref:alpha/beta hydrolase n=1 Tax=Amycolatopsis sp. cg5 TaxID=3238802 RepID=UPI003523B99B
MFLRRCLAVLTALLVLTSGLPAWAATTTSWTDCGDGFECTTLQVPRDYRNPALGTIPLAVNRHRATDHAHRVGALLVNPGGPGGSGLGFAKRLLPRFPELAARFDVIGFDPRGVGQSGQVQCLTDEETRQDFEDARPLTFERGQAFAARFTAACVARSGNMLPYIGTESVARDMDQIRAALGEERFNYFGVSFGTFIGTVYANLFPKRIRVMALDGAYDPEAYANRPYTYDFWQYVEIEGALNRMLDWCARDASCPFGDGNPRAAFDRLVRSLDRDPVRDADGKVLANGSVLAYSMIFELNGGTSAWRGLAAELQEAATSRTGDLLYPLSDSSSFFAANVSVECADRVYPSGKFSLRAHLALEAATGPRLGPIAAYGPPGYDQSHANACQQWPAQRASRYPGPWNAPGSAPILVVGTTGDPDTPYRDAIALSRTLDNARLLTFVGEGHSGQGHSPCARAAITAYLVDRTLPAPGTRCTDNPTP